MLFHVAIPSSWRQLLAAFSSHPNQQRTLQVNGDKNNQVKGTRIGKLIPLSRHDYGIGAHAGTWPSNRRMFYEKQRERKEAPCPPLHGFCKARDMESTMKILEKMHNVGFGPDSISLNTLINFLCKSGHVHLAVVLFTKMNVMGFEPDEITYGLLVDGLCSADRPDDACRPVENELEYYGFPVPINSTANGMNRAVYLALGKMVKKKFSKKAVLKYSALKGFRL